MPNRIRQDDEVLTSVERFARAEQCVGKGWLEELLSAADRTVQEQDSIALVRRQFASVQ